MARTQRRMSRQGEVCFSGNEMECAGLHRRVRRLAAFVLGAAGTLSCALQHLRRVSA
jgi:hypothetical protein